MRSHGQYRRQQHELGDALPPWPGGCACFFLRACCCGEWCGSGRHPEARATLADVGRPATAASAVQRARDECSSAGACGSQGSRSSQFCSSQLPTSREWRIRGRYKVVAGESQRCTRLPDSDRAEDLHPTWARGTRREAGHGSAAQAGSVCGNLRAHHRAPSHGSARSPSIRW